MKKNALRSLIIVIALALALSSLGVSGAQWKAESRVMTAPAQVTELQPDNATPSATPCSAPGDADKAFQCLKDGNKRWHETNPCRAAGCSGQTQMIPRNWPEQRRETAPPPPPNKQHPFAVVLSCMDSRVPPELIFDQGLGDIFVIRVAGPVLNNDELASLEFAFRVYGVRLVLVLGHTDCGAVKGAVEDATGTFLPTLLDKLEPAITDVSREFNGGRRITVSKPTITPEEQANLDRVSLVNARLVSSQIREKRAWLRFGINGLQVKSGLYYLASGQVAFDSKNVEK
jgi:carbonic anhydrase